MERRQLIAKLNWFYNFELNQVDLYASQSKAEDDDYISLAFRRISMIEQQHMDNMGYLIRRLGANPSPLGDVIAPVIGSAMGNVLSLAGTKNVLKANILLEQKAMKDYKELIHALRNHPDEEIIGVLQSNLIDEDLHAAWFANKLSEI
ncbi:MAG: demethoxyubiquinone hydroxylase family protein [Clostridia bacterium]|jgi:bacterioferritin